MAPGARFEINVDSEAMSSIQEGLRDPSVCTFDLAQVRVFHACESYFAGSFIYFDFLLELKIGLDRISSTPNFRLLSRLLKMSSIDEAS